MPRIPSAADVSAVGAAASRLPTVRADAQDFGLAIAQGLHNLGEGLEAVRPLAEEILRKEEQAEAAEQVADDAEHDAAVHEAAIRMVNDWEYDGSSSRKAATKAARELATIENERLQGLPPERQAAARRRTAGTRAIYGLRIARRAQNARVEALSEKADATLRRLQDHAVREPFAAERYVAKGTALLGSLRDAGALTSEQFAARNEAFRRSLFAAVIQGQPAVDAVADLEAGIYDATLGDPVLKDTLLTQARWRLQSERAQGAAAADAFLEASRRGDDEAAHSARTQRLLDAGAMADAELAAERARRTRETLERVRYAPEAVVREEVDQLAPPAAAADAEERLKVMEETRIQAEAMLRERRRDPAAYVMGQPAVAEAFAAAEKEPALLPGAVTARLAAQAAMGLPTEERRTLTRAESTEMLTGLDALPPAERVAALGALGRRYGEASSAIAAALAEDGLSPVELLLLDPAGDPAAWRSLGRLVERQSQEQGGASPNAGALGEAVQIQTTQAPETEAADRGEGERRLLAEDEGGDLGGVRLSGPRSEAHDSILPDASATEAMEQRHAPVVSTLAAEKELDGLLVTMGINPVLREGNPAFVLPLAKEVMQVRTYIADGDYKRVKELREKIKSLDGTEHRFLYKPLEAKLDRALNRPETVPWALSDGEVYSVYRALGGSTSVLDAGAGSLAVLEKFVPPARFLKWAFSLAGFQQRQMRSRYERELFRRGIFRSPDGT